MPVGAARDCHHPVRPAIAKQVARSEHYLWMWLLLPMVAARSSYSGDRTPNPARDYRPIAVTSVVNQLTYAVISVLVSFVSAAQGLVFGKVAARSSEQASSAPVRFRRSRLSPVLSASAEPGRCGSGSTSSLSTTHRTASSAPSRGRCRSNIFSATSAAAAAGYYGLARMVLSVPNLLASAALSQCFYGKRSSIGEQPVSSLHDRPADPDHCAPLPPLFAFACIWGDLIFATIFGTRWDAGGRFRNDPGACGVVGASDGVARASLRSCRSAGCVVSRFRLASTC